MKPFECFQKSLELYFLKQRIKTIETFATRTGLFDNVAPENRQYTESFLGKNCLELPGYLSFLNSKKFSPLVQLSIDSHKGDKRKATEDPYFKHLFYTGYLCYELAKKLGYDDSQKIIFIGAALFHDVLEMRRKNDPRYDGNDLLGHMTDHNPNLKPNQVISRDEAEKIYTMVHLLTTEPKEANLDTKSYIDRKNADFDYVMKIDGEQVNKRYVDLFNKNPLSGEEADRIVEMVKQIKIADDAAILKETVNDVIYGKDGKKKERNGIRPLDDRIAVYEARTNKIQELYADHPFLKQMQDDISYLKKYILFKNVRSITNN